MLSPVGIFETLIQPSFLSCFNDAYEMAVEDATITNSLIMKVTSIEIKHNNVIIKGYSSRRLFLSRIYTTLEPEINLVHIRPYKFGKFYTTWGKIIRPSSPLGFLTLYSPFEILRKNLLEFDEVPEETGDIIINIDVLKVGESLSQEIFGIHLCDKCGIEIPKERLNAIPETSYCLRCANLLEKTIKRRI
jgi:hypothetical protein